MIRADWSKAHVTRRIELGRTRTEENARQAGRDLLEASSAARAAVEVQGPVVREDERVRSTEERRVGVIARDADRGGAEARRELGEDVAARAVGDDRRSHS
jgi:hypothetical protein